MIPQRLAAGPALAWRFYAAKNGYVFSMQCEQIGTACVILGGGRERKEDVVDPAVGIVVHKKVGDRVAAGEPLATIHYNASDEGRSGRNKLIEASFAISEAPPAQALAHP